VRDAWARLGLRSRLGLTVATIVLVAIAFVVLAVRREVGEAVGAVLIGGAIGVVIAFVAGRMLEEASSRQRQFVADASHELRTPLTAIRGQLEVLARNESPDATDVRRVEGVVMVEVTRIERLVDDMLSLARLDEGEPLHMHELELPGFLRRFGDEPALGPLSLGELPVGALRADPDRLTPVIRNLVANARRHAGPAGTVALSADAGDGRLAVRVDDDGPGIPAGERERVFDRFQRSAAARDRVSGGSGLGLPIARSIVELHGGRIWIEDSPLGGARVVFELGGFEPRPAQLGTA
jgi:signal transduction histidine kinase